MSDCSRTRAELVRLLRDEPPAGGRRALREHVEACPACAAELEALEATWTDLPPAPRGAPPGDRRRRVLAYARRAAREPSGVARLWGRVRPLALPAAGGVVVAVAVVAALALGPGLAIDRHPPVLALGLALAVLVSAAVGGLSTADPRRTTRSVLLGGLGTLAGYLALSLLQPIPDAVEFCQLRVLGDPDMSAGRVCVVYAAVSGLYAGLPAAGAVWWWAPPWDGWRVALSAAGVFSVMALPVLGLQLGASDLVVTATVAGGLALGAAAGGLAGGAARSAARPAGAGS